MGYGPQFARWPTRESRVEWLEEYQRDLEQRVAEVADEIERLKNKSRPTSEE
jgi:predicted RNase H-like nuclease (RuvC/YqgF family)